MDETYPFGYLEEVARAVRPTLKALLEAMLEWATDRVP